MKKMRVNLRHPLKERGDDAYFTPPEAIYSLVGLENLPGVIWEPAVGEGAIANVLKEFGHQVIASDIHNYGYEGTHLEDYLTATVSPNVEGIVTNPPYKLAFEFLKKALAEVDYVALLLRLNFLESVKRIDFFNEKPPSRILVSSRRLPMMHRYGWEGPRSGSNCCYAWFVWDDCDRKAVIHWFDWRERVDIKPTISAFFAENTT
jgi:hypothetical protein